MSFLYAHSTRIPPIHVDAPFKELGKSGGISSQKGHLEQRTACVHKFMELFEPAVKGVVVGDPGAEGTEMGPLVSKAHWNSVSSYVPDDAPVAFRGSAPEGAGFWFPPTVLTPPRDDRTVVDEIFGPVVTVLPFEDEADAIELANDTPYGLSGSISVSPGGEEGLVEINLVRFGGKCLKAERCVRF